MTEADGLSSKRLEFLTETVNFYNSENRSVDMLYYDQYGNGCAIGRMLPVDLAASLPSHSNVCDSVVFNVLPDEMQELGREFLQKIQFLHDDHRHWNKSGLTWIGEDYVKSIKNKFKLNDARL